jgi:hypothetical protein
MTEKRERLRQSDPAWGRPPEWSGVLRSEVRPEPSGTGAE